MALGSSVISSTSLALIESKGTIKLPIDTLSSRNFLLLKDILYALYYSTNVVAASKLINRGYNIDFKQCRILLNGVQKASFRREGSIF